MRTYFKELAEKVRVFLAEEKLHEMVLGCREDQWGEARPVFADLVFADFKKGILIGQFVPSGYEMPAADVREATYPIFEENLRKTGVALRKRRLWLSITHKLGSEDEAELDICEACETSPHDGVSRRRVFCTCQVAPEPSEFGEI